MIGKCVKCGQCCNAIVLTYGIDNIKAKLKKEGPNKDLQFMVDNFEKITREEAIKRNPYLKKIKGQLQFFKCKKWDPKTKLCSDYKNRGATCINYPFGYYKDKMNLGMFFYSEECGHKIDFEIYKIKMGYQILLKANKEFIEDSLSKYFLSILENMEKGSEVNEVVFKKVADIIKTANDKFLAYFHLRYNEIIEDDLEQYRKETLNDL